MKKGTLLIVTMMFVLGAFVFNACTKDDTTKPVITLKGLQSMTITLNSTFTDPGYTANDDEDGDITTSVVVSGTVDVNTAGTYTLTYTVTDAAGNVGTVDRTVKVENAASYLDGTYGVTDVVSGVTNTYTDNITASSTVNNRVWVTKFAYYTNGAVYFTISGNSVTIPSQSVLCGNPAATRDFSGSGTITGNVISINYTEVTNGTAVTGVETYTKQ